VYGNRIYATNSSICQSAMHAGLLTDKGGEIQFEVAQGQKSYEGKKINGVESEEKGSFISSMRFIGSTDGVCNYFTEGYNPSNIFANWKAMDHPNAKDGPSSWSFNTHPTEDRLAVVQSKPISATDLTLPTILVH
jgi:hypothetical protein